MLDGKIHLHSFRAGTILTHQGEQVKLEKGREGGREWKESEAIKILHAFLLSTVFLLFSLSPPTPPPPPKKKKKKYHQIVKQFRSIQGPIFCQA